MSPVFRDDARRGDQTPLLPDADPRSDRPRCGGRESKFLAAIDASSVFAQPLPDRFQRAPASIFLRLITMNLLRIILILFIAACPLFTQAQVNVPLPPPTEWAAPAGMPAAPGDIVNVTFTGPAPATLAPVVGEWNRTAKPGETFSLTGTRFTARTGGLAGSDTRVLLWAAGAGGGTLYTLQMWKVSADLIMASVPDNIPFGVYLVWVENEAGPGVPIILNRAQAEWVGPLGNGAVAGSTKRVFGKDLSTNRGETTSYVYIRPAGGTGLPVACAVTKVEPLAVWFTVPVSLSDGDYEIFVHNGHGGTYGWSQPQKLTVRPAWVRGSTEIVLNDTTTASRSADIQAAVNTLAALPNGGTLRLGPGTFRLVTNIDLPGKVRILGAGKTQTTILGQGGLIRLAANGGFHIAFEEFSFKADVDSYILIWSGSFSGGVENEDLLVRNVDFRVSSDKNSGIGLSLAVKRVEITGCTMDGAIFGACTDWWIHDNQLHGGRNDGDGAIGIRSDSSSDDYGRLVLENCLAKTLDWPVGPGGSRNYLDFLPPSEIIFPGIPAGSVWCARLVHFAVNQASINYSYIAHNTTQDVAIDSNKGETILFHSSESDRYAQVASNSGRTLTIRTDGAIDGNPGFRLLRDGGSPIAAFTSVPDRIGYGSTIDKGTYVVLVDGTGRGQLRRIVSHSATTITVDSDWRVPPDSSSKFVLSFIYLGHLQYKNNMSALPIGWSETQHVASYGVNYDGNSYFCVGESNTNRRTYYGDNIQGYLFAPSYWNEFRDSTCLDSYISGTRITARGGDWGTNPSVNTTLGALCLGNWVRAGHSDENQGFQIIAAGWGQIPANKPFIEGCGFEGTSNGSGLFAGSEANGLFRRNRAALGATLPIFFQPFSTPILIENETTGYFTDYGVPIGNSGAAVLASGLAQRPLAPLRTVGFDEVNFLSSEDLVVANAGINNMIWTAQPDQSWIRATPVPGTASVGAEQTSGRVRISIDPATVPAGVSFGSVTLQSGSFTTTIGVNVNATAVVPENLNLLVTDPFDYGNTDFALTTGTTSMGAGIGLAGSWTLATQNGNNHAAYLAAGLTFGNLTTKGGALRTEGRWLGSSFVSRRLAVNQSGVIYGSYLVSPGTRTNISDPNIETSGLLIGANGEFEYDADLSVSIKGSNTNSATGSVKIGRSISSATNAGTAATFSDADSQTYLVVFKTTSLGSPAATEKTIKTWVLTPSQLATLKPLPTYSLTELALDSATLGTGPNQVLQRAAHTSAQAASFDITKFIQFGTFKNASSPVWQVTYDELRISQVSLDAVTPLQTAPLTALQNWRQANFGTLVEVGASANLADPDGDGMENLLEYAFGSLPNDPASTFRPAAQLSTGTLPELRISFVRFRADLIYIVQASSDLLVWNDIATNPGAVGATVSVTDLPPPGATQRFLRLKVTQVL